MWSFHEFACVARSLSKQEISTNDDADKTVEKEWNNLRNCKYYDENGIQRTGCWDESEGVVQEGYKVRAKIKAEKLIDPNKADEYFGRLCEICIENNSAGGTP